MFIKLIQLISVSAKSYSLREIVVNKRAVVLLEDCTEEIASSKKILPEGITDKQKYSRIWINNSPMSFVIVGELEHLYRLFETDSLLNHRQTIKG